ncbi:MAG: hypothetical protein ACI3U8_08015 [Candidatus Onthomonas sp.]
MKHPLFTRSVSLLLAVLMVISLPAAAVEVSGSQEPDGSAADIGQVETTTALNPFDDSQDTVLPANEEQPAAQEEPAVQEPEQSEETDAPMNAAYLDTEGHYQAPEKLVVYITEYVEPGKEADGKTAEEQYTGVVAFYDYNEKDQEKMLEQPYFFYYDKGVLQSEKTLFIFSDHYLNLTAAPTQEDGRTPEDESRMVYTAPEVFVDPEAVEHPDYLFAFNQEGKENGLYTGTYDGQAYESGLIPAVHIISVTQKSGTGGSPTLTWEKLNNAQSYRIYRRTDAGQPWGDPIGTVQADTTTYTDSNATEVGTTYFYLVRAVYSDGSLSGDTSVVSYTYHAIPEVTAKSTAGGPMVSWNRDADATGYRVFRKSSAGGSWTVAANLTGAGESSKIQWQDAAAKSDQTYAYTVRAYYGDREGENREGYTVNVWSGYKASSSIYYLAAPEITKAYSVGTGISLTWTKVEGASTYKIYRQAADASKAKWTYMGAVKSTATDYVDTEVEEGMRYFYTVRAFNADGTGGVYYDFRSDATKSIAYHATPVVKSVNATGGVKVTWSKDADASGYRVFRKASGESSYTIIANITKGTTGSYLDKTAVSGKTYTYTVRAYYGDTATMAKDKSYTSNLWSPYKTAGSLLYLAAPELGDVYSSGIGMTVKWTTVSGATGYIVYRKTEDSKWKSLTTLTDASKNSYVDKTAEANGSYYYTVRAIYKDKDHISGFYTPTASAVYHAPVDVKVTAASNGIRITWELDSKATGYRVYRKVDGTSVVLAKISASSLKEGTTSTSFVDTESIANGTTCYYTVRPYYGTGDIQKVGTDTKNNWGGCIYQKFIFLSTPVLNASSQNTTSGIKISWTKVPSAAGYRVYRKTEGSSWKQIATISSGATESYVDTGKLSSGTDYFYTVRAVASDKTSLSYFDTTGIYAVYLPAPVMQSVICKSSGTTVKWKAVSGADGYVVYRKTSGGTWERLTTTTDASVLSYKDTAVKNKDIEYYYTVKAYKTTTVNGKKRTSYGAYESGMTFSIAMSGSGWVKKNGNTYYVKDGICLVGWQYLKRNGSTYKYYFDTKTGALVTNLYSYFGKSYRNLKCRIVFCINTNDSNPSYTTIYLYDSETDSYCIPAVSVRCVGNPSKTKYADGSSSAFLKAGSGQRWLDSGSFEQYATYIRGTYSWFHSALYYGSKSPYSFSSSSYNSMVNNNNNTGGCIRMQCIYAYLIQDIMMNGYGEDHRVPVVLYKNTSNAGPFGVPRVDKISSRNSDPTDPAVTGKFFYDTSIWGVSAKAGASAWTYY